MLTERIRKNRLPSKTGRHNLRERKGKVIRMNEMKSDVLNRIGQMVRENKLIVGLLVFIAVCFGFGLGLEHWDRVKQKRVSVAILNAMRLPENVMSEQAMNGNPYAMYALGIRLHKKAKERCKGMGAFGDIVGLYTTSPDVVDHSALNEAGKFLLFAAESAKHDGNKYFMERAYDGLLRWKTDAQVFHAPILGDPAFVGRLNDILR